MVWRTARQGIQQLVNIIAAQGLVNDRIARHCQPRRRGGKLMRPFSTEATSAKACERGRAMHGWALLCSLALLAADEKSAALKPGENLKVEGIGPVPASLVEGAGRYTEFRTADLFSWHPKRREMLIGTRFADTNQIHHVAFPLGARRQWTFLADRVLGAEYRPRAGDDVVYSRDHGGDEFYQFYRYDVGTGASTLVTDGASRNTGAVWSNAGDRMAYGSTRRNRTDVDFFVVDPATPSSDKPLTENQGGGWVAADWSPDDTRLLAGEILSINEGYLWLIDVADGRKTLITLKGGTEKIAYEPVGFTADGRGIYALTDHGAEFMRLTLIDLQTKQEACLTDDIAWDVESARLSHDRKQIALVVNENGVSRLYVMDVASRKRRAIPDVPTGTITHVQWRAGHRELGFSISSARSPTDVYSYDLDEGKLQRWTESETGGLDASTFVEPELVTWKSFDGREISGFLYRAPAKFGDRRPVIINIHGGPEGQTRPIYLGRNNYFLNELGVSLLYPNVRGSSGYGKSFLQLDNGFLREDTYKDIGALLDWIGGRAELDSRRVMVTSGSYGGHMTLAVATRYNDRIRCSLDVVGISNLVTFLERTEGYRRDLRRVEYGDERDPKMREFLNRIAPLNHAADIRRPLFVVQGANDPRVPLSESEQIIETVRRGNTPVWYLMAADEGHGFAKKKNADFQFYATILFVQKFLLPEKSPQ
jgi:dipeptidyl aminopeptidase/acylaminoacyl peptidase